VQFNDRWAWENVQDFAIDTAAVATAGLGLKAKIGLGKRIATVFGVKHAALGGNVIDGLIDLTGALFSGSGFTTPTQLIGDILTFAAKSRKDLAGLFNAGNAVVDASVRLGTAIGGILDPLAKPTDIILKPVAIGKAIQAGVDLLAALMGFWGVLEPVLPKPGETLTGGGAPLPLDPAFRNALLDVGVKAGKPGFLSTIKGRPRVTARFEGRMELPPEPPAPISEDVLEKLFEAQERGERLPDDITITKIVGSPAMVERGLFTRRFSRMGQPDLRRILEELKKG